MLAAEPARPCGVATVASPLAGVGPSPAPASTYRQYSLWQIICNHGLIAEHLPIRAEIKVANNLTSGCLEVRAAFYRSGGPNGCLTIDQVD